MDRCRIAPTLGTSAAVARFAVLLSFIDCDLAGSGILRCLTPFFSFFFQTRLRIRDITGPTFELGLINRAGHVIQGRLHTRTLLKTRSCFVRLKHEGTKLDIFLELENSKVQNAAFRKNI